MNNTTYLGTDLVAALACGEKRGTRRGSDAAGYRPGSVRTGLKVDDLPHCEAGLEDIKTAGRANHGGATTSARGSGRGERRPGAGANSGDRGAPRRAPRSRHAESAAKTTRSGRGLQHGGRGRQQPLAPRSHGRRARAAGGSRPRAARCRLATL